MGLEQRGTRYSLELLGHHAGCERHVGVLTALSGPLARPGCMCPILGHFGPTKTSENSMLGSFHAESFHAKPSSFHAKECTFPICRAILGYIGSELIRVYTLCGQPGSQVASFGSCKARSSCTSCTFLSPV